MNAFPPELLHHHFACMVVAGLTSPAKSPAPPVSGATIAVSSTPSSSIASAPTAPASDATPGPAADAAAASSTTSSVPPDHPTVVFPDLTKSLHEILSSRARNTLWDPSRGRAAVFHTVFADHSARLPPLKTKPSSRHVAPIPSITAGSSASPPESSTAAFAALPPRSPLSPLHPNSPLFPDGLIAPVWVRKHRELVPSVFVSFHCLPTPASSADPEQLKRADEALIKLISERRRTLTERGIKLTIVLLTEREMLDDASLEARLSFIRRSSGLDSRASLFVLTPVSKPELGEFVSSLHSALFEPAADFYREHARRVKRKRTRYPPPPSVLQPIVNAIATLPQTGAPSAKPLGVGDLSWLSREGWIVRSEYKLAVFAELAGDTQEAQSRYREAYDLLCNSPTCLLGSTLMLPPRTKRWAEAKVLADTLCIRICKLLLYADDGEGAALFFRRHVARFTELSTGWGMGAMTFEYWSWLSKQYRLFGELVEHATRSAPGSPLPPLQLPAHAPPLPSKLLHPDALPRFSDGRGGVNAPPGMLLPNSNAIAVSICPYTTLQTPGAYYYLAALCTFERRARFLRTNATTAEDDPDASTGPLAHERKVDHIAQLAEILTKAYDSFKRYRLHRTALFIAARIATVYFDGGQNEMALKFMERIMKSYKKDEVEEVRAGLVEVAAEAAVKVADRVGVVKMLVELLDPSLRLQRPRREEAVAALKAFLAQSAANVGGEGKEKKGDGEGKRPKSVEGVEAAFVEVEAVLPAPSVEMGAPIPFQIVLRNASHFDISDTLDPQHITLTLQSGEGQETNLKVVNLSSSSPQTIGNTPLIVDLGEVHSAEDAQVQAGLASVFAKDGVVALQGSLLAASEGNVRAAKITLNARAQGEVEVQLDLPLQIAEQDDGAIEGLRPGRWLLPTGRSIVVTHSSDPSLTLVKPQRFNVSLSVTGPGFLENNAGSGYVDERLPITITLVNHHAKAVQAWVDATLQPSYDGAHDTLYLEGEEEAERGGERSSQAVKAMPLGTMEAAGGKREVVVCLTPRQAAGVRTIDVAVRISSKDVDTEEVEALPVTATASLAVPVAALLDTRTWIQVSDATQERQARANKARALLDLDDDDNGGENEDVERSRGQEVGLEVEVIGEAAVKVSGVRLVSGGKEVEVDGEEAEENVLGVWEGRDRFSFIRTVMSPTRLTTPLSWSITWSRTSSSSPNTTLVPVTAPPEPPLSTHQHTPSSGLTINLIYTPSQLLHRAFDVDLSICNHHPSRSYSLIMTLDSDQHFTIAGTRRLSLPYVLPQQHRELQAFVRLVPQSVGVFSLPNLSIRLVDPASNAQNMGGPEATLALVHSHGDEPREGSERESVHQDNWSDLICFKYAPREQEPDGPRGAAERTGLPKIVIRLPDVRQD